MMYASSADNYYYPISTEVFPETRTIETFFSGDTYCIVNKPSYTQRTGTRSSSKVNSYYLKNPDESYTTGPDFMAIMTPKIIVDDNVSTLSVNVGLSVCNSDCYSAQYGVPYFGATYTKGVGWAYDGTSEEQYRLRYPSAATPLYRIERIVITSYTLDV